VEENPGPTVITPQDHIEVFVSWASKYGDTFLEALDKVSLARGKILLAQQLEGIGMSLETFQLKWSLTAVDIHNLPPLIVAYQQFAAVNLLVTDTSFLWVASQDAPDIASLQEELRQLKLQVSSQGRPPAPPALKPLCAAAVSHFQTLPGRPQWMHRMSPIFSTLLLPRESPGAELDLIAQLWEVMVDAYSENQRRFRPSSSQSSVSSFAGAGFSLDQALQNGGTLSVETHPRGSVQFLLHQGKKWYVSQKSRQLWDTTLPPPSACFSCGEHHWFWQCQAP
jgi:hypothetical protein